MDRVPTPKLIFQMPGLSWIRGFLSQSCWIFLWQKKQTCLISIRFKKWNAGFLFAFFFFINKAERGIMHYIFSEQKLSICGVKNWWWNSLKMHKTFRILLFLVSSQVRFDRLLQPEGWESNKTKEGESFTLCFNPWGGGENSLCS